MALIKANPKFLFQNSILIFCMLVALFLQKVKHFGIF
jgi:hypothetical protein